LRSHCAAQDLVDQLANDVEQLREKRPGLSVVLLADGGEGAVGSGCGAGSEPRAAGCWRGWWR
jgi:hypothetical protein